MKVVSVENLRKTYNRGKVVAVDGISFSVNREEIYIFVGPDGAGKSSTLKVVAGVLYYDDGKVELFGQDIKSDRVVEKLKDKIAFMPQGLGLNLYHTLSVEENIDFFANLHDVPVDVREKRKKLLLEATGLLPFKDREAGKLSGGMMQKLGICCSLIHTPELIILDEPTTGVDPVSRRELWKLIYRFVKEEGITALISTSYLDEAERSTTLSIMKSGKLILTSSPEALLEEKIDVYEAEGKDVEKAYEIAWKYFRIPRLKGKVLRFVADDISPVKNFSLSVKKVEPSVEDLFLLKTGLKRVKLEPFFKIDLDIPEDAIVVKNVVKKFGDFTAVDSVSFTVKRGEIFGLLGPNGAGKTTLIKMMTGLYNPTSGECFIAGFKGEKIKRVIGYMSQKFSLYNDLTVYENMVLWGKIYNVHGDVLKDRIEEALRVVDLEKYRDYIVESLPLGIKQRLALMCAVIHGPAVLFLDEPTSGVDPAERDAFWQIIRFLVREIGVTVIVTTHYMDEAEYCDRILLMNRGRAIAFGTPSFLKNETLKKIGRIYEIKTENPFADVDRLLKSGFNAVLYGRKIRIYSKDELSPAVLEKAGVKIISFRKGDVTMEDVFVYAVGSDEF
ncbi:ATP-binding cassette domain-containing protein [Desulfurobacterium atlanticum]|uniref:ABC-2 type transport system ATP-binding protein/ribosome-dependent ATPase n=1 Tax=Desulfurobacterium atlanticum TaxID=240169 RepID=A0A238Y5P0_9BACT|nr:ATP-binding cassette domain-containing protein [Desulfurobacterium atlanticum]SNR66586.1 ABC-2 type transport system ATP-binding protein/ribosome-dependent ATPase [Desulfurobacterium atlanticum]